MANPPPSFSSFPDLPSFAPPPPQPSSSSRHAASSSSRRSRSPGGSRKGKAREDRDHDRNDERRSYGRRRDGQEDSKRRSRRHDEGSDGRDRAGGGSSSSHTTTHHRRRRSRSPELHSSSSRHRRAQDGEPSRGSSSASAARPAHGPVPGPPELPAVNELYYAASRGDEANITYGSLHKYSLAKFRRAGAGSVVGLPRNFKIAREPHASGSSALLMEWIERGRTKALLRYSDKLARSMLNSASLIVQPTPATAASSTALGDYVRFSKRRRLEEPVDAPYRSIEADERETSSDEEQEEAEGGAALREGVFGRLEAGGDEEETASDVETKESAYRTKNVQFAQRSKEAPLDVDNWIAWARFSALAGFDDRPLAASSSSSTAPAGPSVKSRSSIVFTILDRAALSHPALELDPAFLLALLEAAEQAEEPNALAARWDRALEGPLNMDVNLWRAWGNWKMSSRSGQQGESDDITLWAEEGLERLRAMWRRAVPGSLESEDLEGVQIYLLLRACFALREAGYVERAFAIFQAQMEITFYLPHSIARWPWTEQLSALEKFWDTEAPRFGEPAAKGWCNSDDGTSAPSAPSQRLPPSSAADDPFTRWLEAEAVADETILSARTEDEPRPVANGLTDEDDPYKLVLFPDVQGFVTPLYSASSRTQLVYALFSFLDLPFVPPEVSTSTPFFSDSFLLNTLAHSPLGRAAFFPDHLRNPGAVPRKLIGDGGMEPEQEGGIPSPYDCPVRASPVTPEALVPASTAGPSLLARHSVDDRLKPVISNTLEQLRRLFPDDVRYALYALSFEASQNCKSAIKRAKSILAEHQDSFVLWNAYARLERQRGRVADARKVYLTALSLSSPEVRRLSALGDGEVWTLFKGWAELEWSEGRTGHAIAIVAAAASGDFSRLETLAQPDAPIVSPMHALQTRQFFSQAIPRSLDPSSPPASTANSTNLIYLAALFEYLVLGLQAASDVYDRHLGASIPPAAKEELHLQYADLLYRHLSTPQSTFQPARVRAVLERAIAACPSNTALLAYYAATESRMRYQNRMRKMLDDVVLAPASGAKGPNAFLFAVWAELRAVKGRHNEWAVRNLFERAFDRPDANQSLSLWRLAIDHEILLKQLKRAKGLLYRAIKACPWSKDLYLLPFGALRSAYTAKELEELSDLMAERRIRVRVPLDSFVAGWQDDASECADDGDAMLDEAFLGADELRLMREQEERRRLMPY